VIKKIAYIFLFFFVMYCKASAAIVSFNYSPASIYFGQSDQKPDSINLIEENALNFTDKCGNFYFSKLSLSLTSNPEKIIIPHTDNRFAVNGLFFDVMHKTIELEPINIKYLENGGKAHAVTSLIGYTYNLLLSENSEGFMINMGFGLAKTFFYKNSFSERTGCDNWAPVIKTGLGYKIKTIDNLLINIGFDLITPASTYHKVEGNNYSRFTHGGLYPYIGVSF